MALAKAEIGSDGVGCEPASAVTLAGLKKLVSHGFVKRNESAALSIELIEVSYGDGKIWRIASSSMCRVTPDPMMLIANH